MQIAGHSGCFITFEGVEGAGKSSRCKRLCAALEERGFPVLHTREPGGPPAAERIREILLDPGLEVTPLTELMLYLASRASNVDLVVRPALEKGIIVVCERYSDATFAYQIGGRGLPEEQVREANRLATSALQPDLVILLDLDPETGLERLSRQGRQRDRIELEKLQFHRRVRDKYLQLADSDPRYMVIDARGEPEVQDAIIEKRVLKLLRSMDIGGKGQ